MTPAEKRMNDEFHSMLESYARRIADDIIREGFNTINSNLYGLVGWHALYLKKHEKKGRK